MTYVSITYDIKFIMTNLEKLIGTENINLYQHISYIDKMIITIELIGNTKIIK